MSDQRVVAPGAGTEACLASYLPDPRRYDELLDEQGAVRAHWRALVERLSVDKSHDAARRALELTRRLIVENGVAYNVYSDPQGADRPWALDPLPLVLSQDEWRSIEKGVAQRARVLEALLADLYGPQRLLAEGLVPPELPFGHPEFPVALSRPRAQGARAGCISMPPTWRARPTAAGGCSRTVRRRLREPGTRWRIATSSSRCCPAAIRDLGVRRVRDFFGEMRERLRSLFDDGANPLVVILTPGPFNETYFEHAYMARQLGLPLVEGHDLTVRNEIVYLKTLGGLKRVHTILRRLDDDYCDPVELRGASALGVPGLISAVRAQNVVITNALGTGVLESAAWLGFLPGVAERLLGESLRAARRRHLVVRREAGARLRARESRSARREAHLSQSALRAGVRQRHCRRGARSAHTAAAGPSLRVRGAGACRTVAGACMALERHAEFCGAGHSPSASTPSQLHVGFRVLPGGLARVAAESAVDVVSTQRGGGSKDIWVLVGR